MTHIELPRALEDYFAFAETDPTRAGRRFSITLPYFEGARLDRLQWWYHLTPDQEERFGDTILKNLREQATARFIRHIERWLENTRQRLYTQDDELIPRIAPIVATEVAVDAAEAPLAVTTEPPAAEPEPAATNVVPWPAERVANG
jgi:hypothetical protein